MKESSHMTRILQNMNKLAQYRLPVIQWPILLAAFAIGVCAAVGQVPTLGTYLDHRCTEGALGTATPGCPLQAQSCIVNLPCIWCYRKRGISGEDGVCKPEQNQTCTQLSTAGMSCGTQYTGTCLLDASGASSCSGSTPSNPAVNCTPAAFCR